MEQYWGWIDNVLPQGPQMHAVGLAAVPLGKGDLGQQVVQGAEAKMTALYFHKQEMQSRAQDERQLIPYAG
jgi:hypothetical protein